VHSQSNTRSLLLQSVIVKLFRSACCNSAGHQLVSSATWCRVTKVKQQFAVLSELSRSIICNSTRRMSLSLSPGNCLLMSALSYSTFSALVMLYYSLATNYCLALLIILIITISTYSLVFQSIIIFIYFTINLNKNQCYSILFSERKRMLDQPFC